MKCFRFLVPLAVVLGLSGLFCFRTTQAQPGQSPAKLKKPQMADTIKANIYADNWFMLYINGELVAVDPIKFTPHNVVSIEILPEYPMTIAVLAKDNADPATGLEYGTSIGDGGFCLKIGEDIVTDGSWKAKSFFHGPINGDTAHPSVRKEELPDRWWTVDFDDRAWPSAKVFTEQEVDPKPVFREHDFTGASFIWADDPLGACGEDTPPMASFKITKNGALNGQLPPIEAIAVPGP